MDDRDEWLKKFVFDTILIAMIEDKVLALGEKAKVARQYGVSPQYLADVLEGRRKIGPKLAAALGYTPATVYLEKRQ